MTHSDAQHSVETTSKNALESKLEAEIEAALGDMSLEDMVDMAEKPQPRAERQTRTGTIMSIHGTDVFVEFGPKSQGVCPLSMFEKPPLLGEKMEFNIDRFDKDDGLLILSRKGSVQKAEWETLTAGQIVEARCTGINKGGLEMEVASHRAFMPAGQVDIRHIEDLSVFIGEKMPCEVIEMNRSRARIILSRRSILEKERTEQRAKLLDELEVGQKHSAVITSIQQYGAFADIGGIDGLIHISDLSYQRLKHPSEVIKEGQQVTVLVLKIDESQTPPRISLGVKQTMDDPTVGVIEEIKEGETVTGRVTQIKPFGAFVELAPGVEGLVHISQLSHDRIRNIHKFLKVNEIIKAKVIDVDAATKRISLSVKALKEEQQAEAKRADDARMNKMRSQLNKKFGPLRGGLG